MSCKRCELLEQAIEAALTYCQFGYVQPNVLANGERYYLEDILYDALRGRETKHASKRLIRDAFLAASAAVHLEPQRYKPIE